MKNKILLFGLTLSLASCGSWNRIGDLTTIGNRNVDDSKKYTLLTREVEKEILPLTKELNMTFVPFSPLARGLMTNNLNVDEIDEKDFRRNLPRMNGSYLENNQNLAAGLAEIAVKKGISAAQLALAWV